MKPTLAKRPLIRIAVVGSDPLQFVGFQAVFHSERDFELICSSPSDVETQHNIDLVLLGDRSGENLFDVMAILKKTRPNLRIIVVGSAMEDEAILNAIAFGAKGYADATASPAEFVQAIRTVSEGSVWVSRRILSMLIERVNSSPRRLFHGDGPSFTGREIQVLEFLVGGRSNKEIGDALATFHRKSEGREERKPRGRSRGLEPERSVCAVVFKRVIKHFDGILF
jgi:DNA-binding NarL/FixJ family response regulator